MAEVEDSRFTSIFLRGLTSFCHGFLWGEHAILVASITMHLTGAKMPWLYPLQQRKRTKKERELRKQLSMCTRTKDRFLNIFQSIISTIIATAPYLQAVLNEIASHSNRKVHFIYRIQL